MEIQSLITAIDLKKELDVKKVALNNLLMIKDNNYWFNVGIHTASLDTIMFKQDTFGKEFHESILNNLIAKTRERILEIETEIRSL